MYGDSAVPLYVLNVTYPLIDDEIAAFCAGKRAVLMVEEGQPEFIEQALNTVLRRRDIQTRIAGKDVLPMAGEYTAAVVSAALRGFLLSHAPRCCGNRPPPPDPRLFSPHEGRGADQDGAAAPARLLHRTEAATRRYCSARVTRLGKCAVTSPFSPSEPNYQI